MALTTADHRGVLHPGARLLSGAMLCAAVVVTDAARPAGIPVIVALVAASLLMNGGEVMRVVRPLAAGTVMYLPVVFLVRPDIAVKGFATVITLMVPVMALPPAGLFAVIVRLPVPVFVRLLLLQMLHQAETLRRETRGIHGALAVRGGVHGVRGVLSFARALPSVWLPRVAFRAERVARAMEVRGYGEALPYAPARALRTGDVLHVLGAVACAVAAWLVSRSVGGAS